MNIKETITNVLTHNSVQDFIALVIIAVVSYVPGIFVGILGHFSSLIAATLAVYGYGYVQKFLRKKLN